MTGGYTLSVNWATRLIFRNVRSVNGWNGIHLVQTNTTAIEQCQFEGYRGTNVVLCDGTTQRSDCLRIVGLSLSGDGVANPDLFTVDGYFNTLQVFGMVGIRGNHFIWHKNSASTTVGNFARYYDTEGDLSNVSEQIRLDVGVDIHFTDMYSHGSNTTDGIYIANGVDLVSFKGGRSTGHYKCGINNNGSRVKVMGTLIGGNSQASSAGYSAVYCGPTAVKFNALGCETGLNIGITKMQKYGFEVAAGATDCNWIGGSLKDNVTGEWIDNSGGSPGNVNVTSYSGTSASSDDAYDIITMTAAGSLTMAKTNLILSGGSTVSSYTVTLPPSPRDGKRVRIKAAVAITAFTLTPNTGQNTTHANVPASLIAGQQLELIWRAGSASWY
jgi:hypothetical protein